MTETTLTIAQISNLSGILSGGRAATRAATKAAAAKRFRALAEMNGVQTADEILAMDFEAAKHAVGLIVGALGRAAAENLPTEAVAEDGPVAWDRNGLIASGTLADLAARFGFDTASVSADLAANGEALTVYNGDGIVILAVYPEGELSPSATAWIEGPAPRPMSEPQKSPGLARLRASKNAEEIRLSTLAASEAATEIKGPALSFAERRLAAGAVPETSEGRTGFWQQTDNGPVFHPVAKPAKAKAEKKAKPAKAEKAARAPRVGIDPSAKITAVVANPKQKGSRAFACFALYQVGQTVGEFMAAAEAAGIPATEAKANLSWDRRKAFVTVVGGAA